MILEQGLIKDGVIKIYKESNQDQTHSNDKSWYWNKNNTIVTNGAIDTRYINIAAGKKPKFPKSSRTYTPLGEPLDVIFEKLAKDNLICYPPMQKNANPTKSHPRKIKNHVDSKK